MSTEEKLKKLKEILTNADYISGAPPVTSGHIIPDKDFDWLCQEIESAWIREKIAVEALEKVEDTRKIGHKEPNDYTMLGCLSHIASEALSAIRGSNG